MRTTRVSHNPVVATILVATPLADSKTPDEEFISSFSTWHRCLGHCHASSIKTVLDICKVSYQNKYVIDLCNACCLGKTHRLHFPPSYRVHHSPFKLVFTNLWGLTHYPYLGGYFYYITFVDVCIKFTWIYFLSSKSEAFQTFTHFQTLITTQFNAKLKSLQTEWGGEYRAFTKYLSDHGIIHRITCPYASHQNGSFERKHKQTVEMGLTILAQAEMPYQYWDHSFTTAIYHINRFLTSALP